MKRTLRQFLRVTYSGLLVSEVFDDAGLGVVAYSIALLDDAGVTTFALSKSWSELFK